MASKKSAAPAAPFTGVLPNTMPLPKLRDIGEFEVHLNKMLEAAEGEVTPEIEAFMAQLDTDRAGFFERWGLHIRNEQTKHQYLVGAAAPFSTEADRIMEKAKVVEARVKHSKERLLFEMTKRGLRHIEGKEVDLNVIDNPPRTVNTERVPVEVAEKLYTDPTTRHLVKYTPEAFEIDKDEVKKAVAAGLLPEELIDLGVGVERGIRLSID